jgi:two-component system nitrogen regulation sensor histidine kinase NtrY
VSSDFSRPASGRTLERRLFGWTLSLTLVPALVILIAGGLALATALDIAAGLGPWEEVAASGREVVDRAAPGAATDPELAAALDRHRDQLSTSLTQARRWAFLGDRFVDALPWLVLGVGLALLALAWAVTRRVARQIARPIEELVVLAERLGREEPLPAPSPRAVREVRFLDGALRAAAADLAAARDRALADERLRVWGEMARRVAHEMKNPLTPLRLVAHRLTRSPSEGGVAEAAEVVAQEVARLEELAAQFSALGRPPEGPPIDIDVRELLQSLLETDVPPGVDAALDAPGTLPPVRGHYDELFRAFRNLVRNAVDAVESEEAPRILVDLRVVEEGDDGAGPAPARWLEARIADNGPGLPADGADRIFEPDFTTKTRGTGLGLALVRQAVISEGGSVAARTGPTGAELLVRLPLAATRSTTGEDHE